jgi:hypothetical protein
VHYNAGATLRAYVRRIRGAASHGLLRCYVAFVADSASFAAPSLLFLGDNAVTIHCG